MRRAVAGLVLALTVAGCTAAPPPGEPPGTPGTTAPDAVAFQGPGGWEPLPDAPTGGRSTHGAVWMDGELLVVGGFGEHDSAWESTHPLGGAAYDPTSRTWREVADPPTHVTAWTHQGVWTGAEAIFWGEAGGGGDPVVSVAYDPSADTWRELPLHPLGRISATGIAWTGEALLVWGSHTSLPDDLQDLDAPAGASPRPADPRGGEVLVARYDPDTDVWTQGADSPLSEPRFSARGVWTGEELIVWGGAADLGSEWGPPPETLGGGAAYDPAADTWRELEDPPADALELVEPHWVAGRVVGLDRRDFATPLHWDPDGRTVEAGEPLPDPLRAALLSPIGRDQLVAYRPSPPQRPGTSGAAQRYDVVADRWHEMGPLDHPGDDGASITWTGDALLLWGGQRIELWGEEMLRTYAAGGFVWRPDGTAAEEPEPDPDWEVTAQVRSSGDAPFSITVGEAEGLSLGGYADIPLILEAQEDVRIEGLDVAEAPGEGTAEEADGVLLVLGPGCGWSLDTARAWQGPQPTCGGWARGIRQVDLRAARALEVPITLYAHEPPWAPTPGSYEAQAELGWWFAETLEAWDDARRADRDGRFEELPPHDGQVRATLEFTLEGVSAAGRDPRTGQAQERAAAHPGDCRSTTSTIQAGDPQTQPGAIRVEIDGLGHFGTASRTARTLETRPPGAGPAGRGWEHVVWLDGFPLRECVPFPHHMPVLAPIVEQTEDRLVTTASHQGLELRVEQTVEADPEQGGTYTYRLTVTNPGEDARTATLTRAYTDLYRETEDEAFDADGTPDGAQVWVRARDAAVIAEGDLDGRATPDRWGVGGDGIVADGEIRAASGASAQDNTRTLAQQWDADVPAGGSITLTVRLRFGPPPV